MGRRAKIVGQLIDESLYVVDNRAVAEAMLIGARARRLVPDLALRAEDTGQEERVRSFRPHRGARSFRLSTAARR